MLCSEHGYSYEWKIGVTPQNWLQMGRQLLVHWTTSYLSSYHDCHHFPAAVCLQHRDQQISPIIRENWEHCQIQWRLDVTISHAGSRCWHILTSRPRGTVKQQTRWTRKIQRKAFLIGYRPSQTIWRTWRRMCPHIPLKERTQIRKVMLRKWRKQERKHSIHTHFPKRPKLRRMLENQNYEGSSQKTLWEIYSASRKLWWLDNSRAQSPQRRKWTSEQSPFRCRGTRSCHTMDTVLSV